ncbi:MAG: hypothetical protein E6713_00740 [Sporomusaceae bacterium]|nr:hypothetical protein [Sporomusaceae bacterium]
MNRKIIALVLVICLSFSFASLGFAQGVSSDMTALEKLSVTENIYYGSEQTGSLIDRTKKLEKDIFGASEKDPIMTRIDRLYAYTKLSSIGSPSFILRLNAAEWNLLHNVTNNAAKARLESLETTLSGSPTTGAFDTRLTKLMRLAFTDGQIDLAEAAVKQDTLVKIKLLTPLTSKDSRPGDTVSFIAAEDIFDNGVLIVTKGAVGHGTVKAVDRAGNLGRDGKLQVEFNSIEAVDGSELATVLGDKAKEKTNSVAKVAGASMAGMILLGPIGILGGAFVHGKDNDMPAGSEIYIQTKSDTRIYGVKIR